MSKIQQVVVEEDTLKKSSVFLQQPKQGTYLRKGLVPVVLADRGTRFFDVLVESTPEGSAEGSPCLHQNPPLVVLVNWVSGMVRDAVGELVDHRFDGRLLQHAIELSRREIRYRDALRELLGVHLLEGLPLTSNGIAIWREEQIVFREKRASVRRDAQYL